MSRNTKPMTRAERQAAHAAVDAEAAEHTDAGLEAEEYVEKYDGPPRYSDRPIRSEHRDDMMDLKEMANKLAAMPVGHRRTLPLGEELQEQLDLLGKIDGAGRRRLLMRVKLLLGGLDRKLLEAALSGDTPAAARDRECIRWRTRLLAGDDVVLQQFIEAHPTADRQALRTHIRDARGTTPGAERARTRLLLLVREAAAAELEPE
jgi:ribosomal 50S subunit-associated protein YjgA (DUF615 family)